MLQLDEITRLVEERVSTGELLAGIEALRALDRFFTFPKFAESARLAAKKLADLGLAGRVLEQPADGTTRMGDWTMPLAWDCHEALLELVEPETVRGQVLCRRSHDPNSVAMWSAPTGPQGVLAEVVGPVEFQGSKDGGGLVLAGPDGPRPLADGELAGRIAFTPGDPRMIKRLLARAGAAGAVTSFMPAGQDLPENRFWVNGWSDDPGGWAFTARDTPMWCFVLTPAQGRELAGLLAAGPVKARAFVDSRLYEGVLPAVTGALRGRSGEEVLLLGHMFEIGADDNASGCAVILEAARVLADLVASGKLPEPRRSVRFLLMSECYGSMAWAAMNPGTARRTLAAMNLDCVGADQRKARCIMPVALTPAANPSVADALILRLCEGYLRRRRPLLAWRPDGFSPCDTTLGDPVIGVPTVYLGGKSAFWHTTADTLDKIDPDFAAAVTVLAASFAYYLAAAGSEEAEWLAEESAADGRRDLVRLAAELTGGLRLAPPSGRGRLLAEADERIEHARDVAIARVRSAQSFAVRSERREFRQALRPVVSQIKKQANLEAAGLRRLAARLAEEDDQPLTAAEPVQAPAWQAEAESLVPVRKAPGVPTLEGVPSGEHGLGSPRWSEWLANALFRCDGRRTLAEALRLGTLDAGAALRPGLEPVRLFRLLEERGLVELRPAPARKRPPTR